MGEPAGAPLIGAALEASTEELASVMRCPVCQVLSVADSPTNSAIAMKREVREFLAAGYSPEQILDYFERSYGEFIRLEPKPTGFNWAVWLTPIAALLAGVALLVWRMRRQRSSPQQSAEASELAAYLERVRQEVSG